jgi:hypothetical protein
MTAQRVAKRVSAKSVKRKPKSMPAARKDPKGGLTAKGRAFFNQRDGSRLRPGVKGAADTPEKIKRKGSFLTRHFTHPRGPMVDEKGEPTRLALSAHAWGEAVPKTEAGAKKLAAKGRKLLETYHRTKDGGAAKSAGAKKRTGRSVAKRAE